MVFPFFHPVYEMRESNILWKKLQKKDWHFENYLWVASCIDYGGEKFIKSLFFLKVEIH